MPTTAGTGSEVGRAALIVEAASRRKVIIFHPQMLPKIVLLDADFTVGLPPHLTAATGMDALSHLLEAYCSPVFHPMAEGIARQGMIIVRDYLARAVANGADLEARTQMQIASMMGATAFQKGLGAMHALAHPLGANFAECAFEGNWTGRGWVVHLRWTGSVRGDALDPDHPSGALPQIGDIHRTAETYAWLNGQRRHKTTTVLDVAKDVDWIRNLNAQAFFQVIRGAEFHPSSLIYPANQWWVGCGIRTTGPFLGADW